jgi:multidrug efflux pump subunit AcrB
MKNDTTPSRKEGFAGKLASAFVKNKLTPVIIMTSILLGVLAVALTPKEEEPQIIVPMIDIQIDAPGFEAAETERKITEPVERAVWGIDGVEYVYSASSPNSSLITVRFKVGQPMESSLVNIHHKMLELKNQLPPNASVPKIRSFSIDDVPFLVLTFSSSEKDDYVLRSLVAPLARELSSTPDLSRIEMLGGRKRTIRVIADPARTSAHGISMQEILQALNANNMAAPSGKNWGSDNVYNIEIGGRLSSAADISNIAVGLRAGKIIHIKDIASIQEGPEERTRVSYLYDKTLSGGVKNAVSVVFAKKKGTNAVNLAKELEERAAIFSKNLPSDIKLSTVRNYGETARDKSNELIQHLLIATFSVAALIALFMGLRVSLVISIAIPVTLALTLASYYFLGYSLNRVTLFALIFSIGILVDDAIVVVENIERHLELKPNQNILKTTIAAVSEVGNPTILATFTVIAAIMPMAFVSGLMGPYMKPIPVGASLAMILSLFVAFIVTPWASVKLLKRGEYEKKPHTSNSPLKKVYMTFLGNLLFRKRNALIFGALTGVLLLGSMSLFMFKTVKVKMLPFDNKNEFQIIIDYPSTTPLAKSAALSKELAESLLKNKDVEKVQIFAGEPAPFSFSGMVKHSYFRYSDYMNDFQVVLTDKSKRALQSHAIIESLRPVIAEFGKKNGAVIKVLEVPPGPPVMATLVAEVYGPDRNKRESVARELYKTFSEEPSVADLDYSLRPARPRRIYLFDRNSGGLFGINAAQLVGNGQILFSETPTASISDVQWSEEVSVDLSIAQSYRSSDHPFKGLSIPTYDSGFVFMDQVLTKSIVKENRTLNRKNLKPVEYVTSELTGSEESPVYGILKLSPKIPYKIQTAEVPWNTQQTVVKWDGEWFVTYEVFRDLGAAFPIAMVLIYILVLGWFRSYIVPLVIMAPIPISLIGIIPGHAIMGSYFTATSMIGFIAGAGIIVRNSIILVDFIEQELKRGIPLKQAVVNAGVTRFRPMLLTAMAVVTGSFVMLFDPIFQGLAISLIFGEVAATVLSWFSVPVLYYWLAGKKRMKELQPVEA